LTATLRHPGRPCLLSCTSTGGEAHGGGPALDPMGFNGVGLGWVGIWLVVDTPSAMGSDWGRPCLAVLGEVSTRGAFLGPDAHFAIPSRRGLSLKAH